MLRFTPRKVVRNSLKYGKVR